MKHTYYTKGPWVICCIEGKENQLMIGDGDEGADIFCDIRSDRQEYANLIAAAPDLLEALEVCLSLIKKNGNEWTDSLTIGLAEQAIAKARGES